MPPRTYLTAMSPSGLAPTDVTAAVRAILTASDDKLPRANRDRVVLAVSGGVDSMVLLDAASRVLPGNALVVAAFDHGTGAFARSAIEFVEAEATARSIRCIVGRAGATLLNEAAFRAARWQFLRRVARDEKARIATAHSASDQVETVLMRVMRDAGARGLAGLFASSDILRPLLTFSRPKILAYARSANVSWIEDPSNTSSQHLRNRVRHDLLPALRRVHPSIDSDLLEIARDAAEWRRDVDAFVEMNISVRPLARGRGLDIDASAFSNLSLSAAAALWPAILAKHGVILDRRGIARVAEFGASARVGARMQLRGGWQVVRSRDALQLRASDAVSVRDEPTLTPLALSNGTAWGGDAAANGDGDWLFRAIESTSPEASRVGSDLWSAWLPTHCNLSIRSWRAGDTMAAASGRTPRKIKQLLSEAGVTGHQRMGWPVVLADDQIVWVPGVRHARATATRSPQSGLPFICDYFDRQRYR